MTARRTYILAYVLLAAVSCRAGSQAGDTPTVSPAVGPAPAGPAASAPLPSVPLSDAQYRADLDGLLSAAQELDSSGKPTPQLLTVVPQSWRVHTDQREFEISAEGLRRDVRRYEKEKNVANASAIRARVQSLRDDLDGYERPPVDASASRAELSSILARREFREDHAPKWLNGVREWLDGVKEGLLDLLRRALRFLFHVLSRLFGMSAIPTIGKYFVYGLIGLAVLAFGYFVYRTISRGNDLEGVALANLPVSAKEWVVWLSEARAAAAKGEWRDAIHLAYWAGISFLERQGMWKPDRARTPREYLRLLGASEYRETLTALTRIFELAWYANRGASERSFSETLQELEKLGCR
jgi:hypothetical protein